MSAKRAETQVWEKLYEFVMNPEFLHAQARDLVRQLQQRYKHLQKEQQEILEKMEKESAKRQQVITEARIKMRADAEFDAPVYSRRTIEAQVDSLGTRDEPLCQVGLGRKGQGVYVANLQAGIVELNKAIPKTPEEQHRIFLMKKRLVDELIVEAMINGKRDIQVEFRAKIMDLAVSKQLLDFPNAGEIVARL